MFKKFLFTALIALATGTAYADAPVMIPVTGSVSDQPFTITQQQWGYQFDNKTGKSFEFIATVNSATDPSNEVRAQLQCWNHLAPIGVFMLSSISHSKQGCGTNDSVRLVTPDEKQPIVTGTYTIVVHDR